MSRTDLSLDPSKFYTRGSTWNIVLCRCNNLERRTTYIPRFEAVNRLDSRYSSVERRSSCKYASRVRKPVWKVEPRSSIRRRIARRIDVLEAKEDSDRIRRIPRLGRHNSRKSSGTACSVRRRSTRQRRSDFGFPGRRRFSCSRSSLRCNWCS